MKTLKKLFLLLISIITINSTKAESLPIDNNGKAKEALTTSVVITVSNPVNGGTTFGSGIYNNNQICTLNAIPDSGFNFVNWTQSGNIVSNNPTYFFTVYSNTTLQANFTSSPFIITKSANIPNAGTLTGGGSFVPNQTCTLSATPNTAYTFLYWAENGNIVTYNSSYTFTVNASRNLVAYFSAINFQVTTSSNPINGGTTSGGGTFSSQTGGYCTLHATPNPGYTFMNWTINGNIVTTDSLYYDFFTTNTNLVANFTNSPVFINTTSNPTNGGDIYGGGVYSLNQTCTVYASGKDGYYTFAYWTENGNIISNDSLITFIATTNRNLVANFTPIPYYITTLSNPVNGGTTSGGGTYMYYQNINLYAHQNPGYKFLYWSNLDGSAISYDSVININVFFSRTYVANFYIPYTCSAQFTMTPDVSTPHNYFVYNNASGVPPLHYHWIWGDGTSDTLANPTHTYSTAGWYIICLTITDSIGCASTYCDTSYLQKNPNSIISVQVIPQGSTGITTNDFDKLKVYPNPAKENITIETTSNTKQSIEIVNLLGQSIYTSYIFNKLTIDVSSYSKGIYILKLNSDKGTIIKKFLKE